MRKNLSLGKKLKKLTHGGGLLLLACVCGVITVLLTYRVVTAYNYQPPVRKITKTVVLTPQPLPTDPKTHAPTARPKLTPSTTMPTATPQQTATPVPQATTVVVVAQPARTIAPLTPTPTPRTVADTNHCLVTLEATT
jgi:hypothetical protein